MTEDLMLTSAEWQEQIKEFCVILDPDGWRMSDSPNWMLTPITKAKFIELQCMSTCSFVGDDPHEKLEAWGYN